MLGKQTSERLAALFTPAQLTRFAQAQRLLEEIENAECARREVPMLFSLSDSKRAHIYSEESQATEALKTFEESEEMGVTYQVMKTRACYSQGNKVREAGFVIGKFFNAQLVGILED